MRPYLAVILSLALLAFGPPAFPGQSPQDLVYATSTQMLIRLREEKTVIEQAPERLYELVSEIVLPHFDFERMGRWTLGKYWQRATDSQRDQFINEFRSLLVRKYGSALAEYADEEIVYLPFTMSENDTRVTVNTEIKPASGAPVRIAYRLHRTDSGWKVYDVAIEGISLVTNYRTSFTSTIRQDGLEQLIRQLAAINKGAGTTDS
ncbi:MAG: ABC transporter substrate-binding protein [Gammaproteobacteria bacterium]|nr:ABC transporter substrate-binding protein [Gammaproteobacteria bacterium]